MNRTRTLHLAALGLVVLGAINAGLVGLLGLNLVTSVLGGIPYLPETLYVLVGLAGLYSLTLIPLVLHEPKGHAI